MITPNKTIDFNELSRIFYNAGKLTNPNSIVLVVGSSRYLSNIDEKLISDIDYVVCNTSFENTAQDNSWLENFYSNVNLLLNDIGCIVHENGVNDVGTAYVATLLMHKPNKARFPLHMPLFFPTPHQMLSSSYLMSLVIWRWLADKTDPEVIDEKYVKANPEKMVKRFLCLEYYTAIDHSLYWKIRRMYVGNAPLDDIINAIVSSGALKRFFSYFTRLEQLLNINGDIARLFSYVSPGNAALEYISKTAPSIPLSTTRQIFKEVGEKVMQFMYISQNSYPVSSFMNAKEMRNYLRQGLFIPHDMVANFPHESGMIFIDPSKYCPVCCPTCVYKIKPKRLDSDPSGVLPIEAVPHIGRIIKEARTQIVILTGGGEPLSEWDIVIELLKTISSSNDLKMIEILTSGYKFTSLEESSRLLLEITQASSKYIERGGKINIRISLDDAHKRTIPAQQFVSFLEAAREYSDFLMVYFFGLNEQSEVVEEFSSLLNATIEPSSSKVESVYKFKNFVLPDGRKIKFGSKGTAYMGRAASGLKITPELRKKCL